MNTTWADRPYPKIEDPKLKVAVSFIIGLNVFIFLEIFRPFGIENITDNTAFVAGFGGCVSFSLLISYFFLPYLIPFLRTGDWRLKNEIGFHAINFTLTGILNYLYNTEFGQGISVQHTLPEFILITIAVGLSPLTMLAYFTERFLSNRNEEIAEEINTKMGQHEEVVSTLSKHIVLSGQSSESLELSLDDFLVGQSQNNYVEIHFLKDDRIHKVLFRMTLRQLEEQLNDEDILRIHKSYVVHSKHIREVRGNARRLMVVLDREMEAIPVSRSFDRSKFASRIPQEYSH